MKIKFNDFFRIEENEKYGITYRAVKDVINEPEASEEINLNDLHAKAYIKKVDSKYHLLVIGRIEHEDFLLDHAFLLKSSSLYHVDISKPSQVLQYLAQECGLIIQVGKHYNRFIYEERIDLADQLVQSSPTDIVKWQNPQNHPFILSFVGRRKEAYFDCALAFCIDMLSYEDKFLDTLNWHYKNKHDNLDNSNQYKTPKNIEEDFILELEKCQPGRTNWQSYEKLMANILSYIFKEEFDLYRAREQVQTYDGLERRDLLIANRINNSASFWQNVKDEFNCNHVICEFKNLNKKAGKEEILQLANYSNIALGRFGLIFSRFGLDESAIKMIRKKYADADKNAKVLILSIDDGDLTRMIKLKSEGKSPTDILYEKKEEFEVAY